jgi:hypothetical protein
MLRWDEAVPLWNCTINGPIAHLQNDMRVNMEQWWNYIDRGKPKDSEKNLSQCHFVHQKSHFYWPGCEPGPAQWEAGTNRLCCSSANHIVDSSMMWTVLPSAELRSVTMVTWPCFIIKQYDSDLHSVWVSALFDLEKWHKFLYLVCSALCVFS